MARSKGFPLEEFHAWLETRPQIIKDMAARCPPDRIYRRLGDTNAEALGNIMTLVSYHEDGTVRVRILKEFNPRMWEPCEREVFGIPIDKLIECDLHPEYAGDRSEWENISTGDGESRDSK